MVRVGLKIVPPKVVRSHYEHADPTIEHAGLCCDALQEETPTVPLIRGPPFIFLSMIALWPVGRTMDYWIISHP